MQVKAGSIVNFSDGDYSDYQVLATMRALIDFDTEEVAKIWWSETKKWVPPTEYRYFTSRGYWHSDVNWINWLTTKGYIADLDEPVREIHHDYDWSKHRE